MKTRSQTGFELVAKGATLALVTILVCLTQTFFPVWFHKFAAKVEGFIELCAALGLLILLACLVILIIGHFNKRRRHSGAIHARM
jgi:hypothetical protein